MTNEQLIPNAVGRLDDVVEALKAGDKQKAGNLLYERAEQVREKIIRADDEHQKAKREFNEITSFSYRVINQTDFAERVRVACGGGAVRDGS